MNIHKLGQAIAAQRTALAWLVAALLVTSVQAGEPLGPVGDESQSWLPQLPAGDTSVAQAAELPEQDPQPSSGSIRPPEEMIVEPGPQSEAGVASLGNPSEAQPSEAEKPRRRFWRWIPQGMIPYIGPRTPDEQKHRGLWEPIEAGGWRNQPFAITGFAGVTDGGALDRGHVDQRPSAYEGFNFSWDYDHYWGFEKRLGFGELSLTNSAHQPLSTGASITGEYRLMYYPLGNSRWRPFVTAGVGWSDFYFHDDQDIQHIDTVFTVPFGLGLKYLYKERLAFRADLIDEFTVGYGALSNFHYVALTIGLEFRYGKRLLHLPWHRKDDGS
jgi:hypothetical protein